MPWRDPHTVSPESLAQTIRSLEAQCLDNPQSASLHTCLGMAYAMDFQAYKSMDALEHAVAAEPLHFWARMKLAELQYRLRCLDNAEVETSHALELAGSGWEMERGPQTAPGNPPPQTRRHPETGMDQASVDSLCRYDGPVGCSFPYSGVAMKWNLFFCATALASWLLISHGAPLFAVASGTAVAGAINFFKRKTVIGAMVSVFFSPALLLAAEGEGWKIPFAMLVVFGAAKLMAELFERLGQPGLSGEILAGVLIGPSVLNWMAPSELLDALSTLGTMFLLFRVGLEVKSSELLKVGGTATLVATLGVICPFALGWGIMEVLGQPIIASVFVGAAMVATSVGITAQVLNARGLLQELSSKIILAAAVIDDVQGLLVLAVVSSLAKGKIQIAEITITAVLAIGFTVIVAKWGVQVVRVVLPAVHSRLRVGEAEFILAMLFCFVLSLAAVWIGVAAIVGAFLAGMALAESVNERERYLVHGVAELLVPFFLVGIGMKVDLAIFTEWPVLRLSLLLLAAAVVTKFFGCGLGAIRLGKVEAIRVGVGMIPRGEVGMVVAQLGLGMGAITPMIYSRGGLHERRHHDDRAAADQNRLRGSERPQRRRPGRGRPINFLEQRNKFIQSA